MATTPRDYYEILGIEREASGDDVRRAYRKLALQHHPDRNPGDAAAEARFKEAKEAYEVLSDPQRRSQYDRFGHAGADGGLGGFGGFGNGFGIEDIFESFFGATAGTGRRQRVQRGADLRVDLQVTFEEAAFGVEKDISVTKQENCGKCGGNGVEPGSTPTACVRCAGTGEIRRAHQSILGQFVNVSVCDRCRGEGSVITDPCTECRGQGQVKGTKTLRVSVPPGVSDNTQIRLSGEGEPGPRGGPPGHLYVVLHTQAHRYFRRQNNDLQLELPINVAQAALGTEVLIPLLEGGTQPLEIPAGTQSGRVFKLRNKGVPFLQNTGRGDLQVRIKVVTPTDLSREQKELFRKLAQTFGDEDVVPQENKGFFEKVKDAFGV
jgi:molecular chaperone DnaJ